MFELCKKLDWGSWKNNYIRNPSPSNCQYNKACEDEILNTTKTSLADKKCNNMKKINASFTLFHW